MLPKGFDFILHDRSIVNSSHEMSFIQRYSDVNAAFSTKMIFNDEAVLVNDAKTKRIVGLEPRRILKLLTRGHCIHELLLGAVLGMIP